jgi:hypothetical protein
VCAGGNPVGLIFNVVTARTVTVSGVVQLNGAAATDCTSLGPSYTAATLTFTNDGDPNYSKTVAIPCGQGFAFATPLAVGTYDISVSGDASTSTKTGLPDWDVSVQQGVAFSADSSLSLSVVTPPAASLSGTIQLNGLAPVDCTNYGASYTAATVTFTNKADSHYSKSLTVYCGSAFAYAASLAAGNYDISVSGDPNFTSGTTGLPPWSVLVQSNVPVSGTGTTALNVMTPPKSTLSGSVQLNGVAPTDCTNYGASYTAAIVTFTNTADPHYSKTLNVPCDQAFAYSASLGAGTYDVSVSGDPNFTSGTTGLPPWSIPVQSGLSVSGTTTALLNVQTPPLVAVSGSIQHNGIAPTDCTNYGASYTAAIITFTNRSDSHYTKTIKVACGQAFAYAASLAAGTYDIAVSGDPSYTSSTTGLPPWNVTVATGVTVNTGAATLNVQTPPAVSVSGVLRHNGAPPTDCTSYGPSYTAAIVTFTNTADAHYTKKFTIACGQAFAYAGSLAAGTYDISVSGDPSYTSGTTGLPSWDNVVQAGVSIQGNASLSLNLITPTILAIAGVVQHNGAAPSDCHGGTAASIVLTSLGDPHYSKTLAITCGQAFGFSGAVASGNYQVDVMGDPSTTNTTGIPSWKVTVSSAIQLGP